MITITKGQRVADYPHLVAISPSGSYNEEDLIVCAEDDAPGTPTCMFQAQLVAYGNIVYSSAEPITPAQKEEIAAEQARIAEENAPDAGRIIEPDEIPAENTADEPAQTPSPADEEAPVIPPPFEIQPDTSPADAPGESMSTTTPATTPEIIPEPEAAAAASSTPTTETAASDSPVPTP